MLVVMIFSNIKLRFMDLVLLGALCLMLPDLSQASYQCGIRKHSFVQLINREWTVEEGRWPWHAAIFHKLQGNSERYACGGTLLDENHVLTAAHCVVNRKTQYALSASNFLLHFGQQNLSTTSTNNVQIRDVSKVHIHPDWRMHRNDIAILEMRLPVQYTDYVIPTCLDQNADIDLRNLEGKRGWITGWGTTQTGSISDVLQTTSFPVESCQPYSNDQGTVVGNLIDQNIFCAGDQNGTSPGAGDSGAGVYFSDGDRWVLRGIMSYAIADELNKEVDTSKFVIFINVQRFLTWIREIIADNKPKSDRALKRISERECERFKRLARKRRNKICNNSRYPNTVSIIYTPNVAGCDGVLVNENHVLTACSCRITIDGNAASKVRIDVYGLVDILGMVCHPQYASWTDYHDLAVITLNSPVELSSYIIPACLASNWTENLYDTLLETYENRIFSINKNRALTEFIESEDNQVVTQERCNELINPYSQLPNGFSAGQLCVINTDSSRSSIDALSGSPLQSVNTQSCMYTVVGIRCSGVGMIDKRGKDYIEIDGYTRISHYLDWIEQMVWSDEQDSID